MDDDTTDRGCFVCFSAQSINKLLVNSPFQYNLFLLFVRFTFSTKKDLNSTQSYLNLKGVENDDDGCSAKVMDECNKCE